MKKTGLVLCSVFIFSSLALAAPVNEPKFSPAQEERERRAIMEEIKRERAQYFKKMNVLLENYNKAASQKDKDSIKKDIRELVSQQTDNDIKNRKEFLNTQKERIAEFEKELKEYEKNKESDIDRKVEKLTSIEYKREVHKFKQGNFESTTEITIIRSTNPGNKE